MPPPTNTTAATALDIGTLTGDTPYLTTQEAFDGAVSADLWYAYLPVAGDTGLEIYGYGLGTGGVGSYVPQATVWSGPTSALTQLANSHVSSARPLQQDIVTHVVAGQRVYVRFQQLGGRGNPNPSTLTLRIARWQDALITDGDLFINDSSPGYPGIVLTRAGAVPKRYAVNYPAGEGQQVLRTGVVAVLDAFTVSGVVLYDVAATGFTVRATPTLPDAHYTAGLSTNQIDTFWALRDYGGTNSLAVSLTATGVVGAPLNLGAPGYEDVVPQANNAALYGMLGTEIRKITNPGGVVTTWLTVDATFGFGTNLLMLTDDTVLVIYEKVGAATYVKRFNLSATLLNTYPLPSIVYGSGTAVERLFADDADPAYFWVWWQTTVANRFYRIRVSDGVIVSDLSRTKFVQSVSQTTLVTGDTVFSGADFSCVPVVVRLGPGATTETRPIRRLRRAPHVNQENLRVFYRKFELDLERGQGAASGDGMTPTVLLRLSRDGGQTWGAPLSLAAGALGAYTTRAIAWRLGHARDMVFEVSVTDPIAWSLVQAWLDLEAGTS